MLTWLIRKPRGVDKRSWARGGEERKEAEERRGKERGSAHCCWTLRDDGPEGRGRRGRRREGYWKWDRPRLLACT
eukprot:765178-Hanusia_phi.AAC.2